MLRRAVPRGCLGLVVAMSMTLACRRGGTVTPTDPEDPTTKPEPVDEGTALHDLARRIDPGPVPGLLEGMPPWAVSQFGLDASKPDVDRLATLLAKWRALPPSMQMQERLGHAIELGLAALALEHGTPEKITDPSSMAALAQLYGTFDLPQMFDPKGLFGSMIGLVARGLAARPDSGPDEVRTRELMEWLTTSLARLPALHRRMAARMMRETPESPDLPGVMDRVAAASASKPELVVALRRHAVELRGRFATAADQRELAMACYADLDMACGDAAGAAARKLADAKDTAFATKLIELDKRRVAAQRVIDLAESKVVDEQLERAKLLHEIGRVRASGEAFAEIRKHNPRDARALVGEIDAKLEDTFDFNAAFATLDGAPAGLEHRDENYFEIAVGIRAMRLMYVVLPQAAGGGIDSALTAVLPGLVPVRHDVAELAALGSAKGLVLKFLLDLGEELLPAVRTGDVAAMGKRARTLLPEVLELRRKVPTSRHAFDLMLAVSQFSPDGKLAMAAAAAPLPIEDATLSMRAAMTRVALAVTFDVPEEIDAVQKVVEKWPDTFGAATRTRALARVEAVRSRTTGDAASRDRAIARYETVLPQSASATDVSDLCNLAVLLVDAGRMDEAGLVLARALALEEGSDLVRMHRSVIAKPVDLAGLEKVLGGSEAQVGLVALGWLIAVDDRPGQRAKWIAKRKELQREPQLRARPLPNAKGVGVASSLQVGVGYSTVNGLELNIDAGPTPRLFVLPPKGR